MSVLFQLFHAEDLQNLPPVEFEHLKRAISNALDTSEKVANAVRERAHEVFHQLTSPAITIQGPLQQDPSQQLLYQIFGDDDLKHLGGDEKKLDILRIAISCEAAASYEALEAVLEVVTAAMSSSYPRITRLRSRDPDAEYSPFNRNGPIYRIYHPEQPPSGQTTSTT